MVSRTFDTAYIRKYKHCTLCLATQSCSTLCDPVDCSPPGASVHGDSLGKNTGVGSLSLLQGIFLTWDQTQVSRLAGGFFIISHQGSPRIMEWVVYPISREFPWPRNGTWISCIAGGSFYQLSYQGSPLHYYFLFTNLCSLEAFKVLRILPFQCNA